jgi:hypothetical protein
MAVTVHDNIEAPERTLSSKFYVFKGLEHWLIKRVMYEGLDKTYASCTCLLDATEVLTALMYREGVINQGFAEAALSRIQGKAAS